MATMEWHMTALTVVSDDDQKNLQERFVRLYTARLGTGDEVFIEQGVKLKWEALRKCYHIALGGVRTSRSSRKSNRRREAIPVFSILDHRGMKGHRVAAARFEEGGKELHGILRHSIVKSDGFLLRIDMRSKMHDARGRGMWCVDAGGPVLIAEAVVSRRKKDKMSRVECDALVWLRPGDAVRVSPRGEIRKGPQDKSRRQRRSGDPIPLPRPELRVPDAIVSCNADGSYCIQTLTLDASASQKRRRRSA